MRRDGQNIEDFQKCQCEHSQNIFFYQFDNVIRRVFKIRLFNDVIEAHLSLIIVSSPFVIICSKIGPTVPVYLDRKYKNFELYLSTIHVQCVTYTHSTKTCLTSLRTKNVSSLVGPTLNKPIKMPTGNFVNEL